MVTQSNPQASASSTSTRACSSLTILCCQPTNASTIPDDAADGQNDLGNLRHLYQTVPQCRTYGCTDTTRSTSSLSGSQLPTSGLPAMPKGAARRANRRAA